MTQNLAIELIIFGGILTAASLILLDARAAVGPATLIAAAVGGTICFVLGLLGMIGRSSRKLAGLVLVLIAATSAVRAVVAWTRFFEAAIEPMQPLWLSVVALFSSHLATTMIREGK